MSNYNTSINVSNKPIIIEEPFAYIGGNIAFQKLPTGTNRASLQEGFPSITSRPIGTGDGEGGVPPARVDFNVLGYYTTSWLHYFQNGGVVQFDSNVANVIGGYRPEARLWVRTTVDGKASTYIVRAKINTNVNPESVINAIIAGTDPNWEIEFAPPPPKVEHPDTENKNYFPTPDWRNYIDITTLPYTMPNKGWLNLFIEGTYYYWYFINGVPIGSAYARGTDYGSTSSTMIPVRAGDVLDLKIMKKATTKEFKDPTDKQKITGISYLRYSKFIPAIYNT